MPRLLPVLGLPLLADAILTLVLKLRSRFADREATAQDSLPGEER